MDEKYVKSSSLRLILLRYIPRIRDFYKYDTENDNDISNSLRHIEIIRTQITDDIKFLELEELESQFIYSVLSDSYYFEKRNTESKEWKINFLRITWKRLLNDLGVDTSDLKVEILKNTYVDSNTREDGRYIYQKYKK